MHSYHPKQLNYGCDNKFLYSSILLPYHLVPQEIKTKIILQLKLYGFGLDIKRLLYDQSIAL